MKVGGWMITFTIVMIAWVFFRLPSFHEAILVVQKMFSFEISDFHLKLLHQHGLAKTEFNLSLVFSLLVFGFDLLKRSGIEIIGTLGKLTLLRWLYYFIILFVILIYGNYGEVQQQFIYFQF